MTGVPAIHDSEFAASYGRAWSADHPDELLLHVDVSGRYEDTGMGTTWQGHAEIACFFHHMLAFAPDSVIEFDNVCADGERWSATWNWSGTAVGPLRLDDDLLEPTGRHFTVPGIAFGETTTDGRVRSHIDVYDTRAFLTNCGLDAASRADAARATVERLYAALGAGDAQAVESLLSEDAVVHLTEGMPAGSGRHVGPVRARDAWWAIGRAFSVAPEPDEWIPTADGGLLVRGTYRGTRRSDQASVEASFTHLFEFHRGRIRRLRQLTDTARWPRPSQGSTPAGG
ncbi:nuclear transport factor 2 family protein [Nitriliruptor alkaliphilus]|uniref:nuclear transport factor 2 family protein n=1 Tax=Nitriliruptor alkaliphilus TaxID=427918 RepID=UPI0014704A81|nr:nuclear transport factor 2 family protein [Nitriliruptor alkaliphilus]